MQVGDRVIYLSGPLYYGDAGWKGTIVGWFLHMDQELVIIKWDKPHSLLTVPLWDWEDDQLFCIPRDSPALKKDNYEYV